MAPANLYPDLASKVPSTLLVVDDDEMNRCILGNIFAPYYSIQEATDGKEGLEMILAQPENLCAVLLDVMMPELDGIQVLRHLKEADALRRLPVFLITAEASGSVMKEAYELGVVDASFAGLDSTPVMANTKQNNPKSFAKNKFSKENHPKSDPDCALGVHWASNQHNERRYEFYWGYKSHVLVDCISGLPLYELTTPGNIADSSVAR